MIRKKNYSIVVLVLISISFLVLSGFDEQKEGFSEVAKVSLREVGHQLLLNHRDSTSLVMPVVALEQSIYVVSFQKQLSFEPNDLALIVKNSFEKAGLPNKYLVEVIQCADNEVAYSYEMRGDKEKNIIPCAGRFLPKNCYTITVRFIKKDSFYSTSPFIYVLVSITIIIIALLFYKRNPTQITNEINASKKTDSNSYTTLGNFLFYPKQNKLVKAAVEISLSRKECELLEIFVAHPNEIVKRDELTKRVWEDHGVIVGRSLDTYISKLRKKLISDESIKITNVHGVGYKLEIKH